MDVPPSKTAIMILNSLSNKSKFKFGLVDKFWDKHSAEQVVKQHLEKELDEKKLNKMISRWETLEDCRRSRQVRHGL